MTQQAPYHRGNNLPPGVYNYCSETGIISDLNVDATNAHRFTIGHSGRLLKISARIEFETDIRAKLLSLWPTRKWNRATFIREAHVNVDRVGQSYYTWQVHHSTIS